MLGLQSLSFWYVVQAMPPDDTPVVAHGRHLVRRRPGVAGRCGSRSRTRGRCGCCRRARTYGDEAVRHSRLLIFAGAIGISLAVLGHYLAGAFQRSRNAERRALELQVLAREAELKSLRAQLDPHFLFNSLNSVAALIGNDTAAARQMCFLMAQFFRKSLTLGAPAGDSAVRGSVAGGNVSRHREGALRRRLRTNFDIADDVQDVSVPPLMLQPLVENAVHHGVAHLLEGGEVCVQARRREGFLELVVANPCDPDRPPSRSTGVGLVNVRSRVETLCGHRASVDVDASESAFRVSILLPTPSPPQCGNCLRGCQRACPDRRR